MNQESKSYWESYYAKNRDPKDSSFFAQFVIPFLKEGDQLLEIGCGNGRDSVFFAGNGINVSALDQCVEEIDYLNQKYADSGNLKFLAADMGEVDIQGPFHHIYSRFSIHSVPRDVETRILNWAHDILHDLGLFFIEVRSTKDELCGQGTQVGENEFVTDHYRRFIVLEELLAKAKAVGFHVVYSLESNGLAPYKDEDPVVIRLVLQKKP